MLIKENVPRGSWNLGKIQTLIPSQDGETRAAKVVLPSKKTINRPLKLLYPIECPEITDDENKDKYDSTLKTEKLQLAQEKPIRQLPLREAAIKARQQLVKQLNPAILSTEHY